MEQNDGPVYEYFVSGRNPDGSLWCPDCVKAQSVVDEAAKNCMPPGAHFLETTVGPMSYWKNCMPPGAHFLE